MKTLELQDKYNNNKVWVIKVTECSHYYMNQKIGSNMFYPKFQRTTKKWLQSIGVM